MNTADLDKALRLCKSSLLSIDLVPILTHFCFMDDTVFAYNDVTAICVPLETGITAGLRGDALLGVLPTLGKELSMEMTKDGKTVAIKSGRTNLKLAAMSADAFIFQPPEEEFDVSFQLSEETVNGIEHCLGTVGINALQREFTGVVIKLKNKTLEVFSTDDTRISKFTRNIKSDAKGEWLLPLSTCKQVVDLFPEARKSGKVTLSFGEKWMQMEADDLLLFSKLMPENAPDYSGMIENIKPDAKAWIETPAGLMEALKRAAVLTAKEIQPTVHLESKGKELTVSVPDSVALGTFSEVIKLSAPVPELSHAFDPVKLYEAMSAGSFALSDRCISVASEPGYTCYIAPIKN